MYKLKHIKKKKKRKKRMTLHSYRRKVPVLLLLHVIMKWEVAVPSVLPMRTSWLPWPRVEKGEEVPTTTTTPQPEQSALAKNNIKSAVSFWGYS